MSKPVLRALFISCLVAYISGTVLQYLFGWKGTAIWFALCLPIGYVVGKFVKKQDRQDKIKEWRSDHPGAAENFLPDHLRED